ncbi:methionine ABC transporter substrate-binding protein [Nocardia terpenica]|uniref:MetQ/NlpA family ABC transporter substrate-binding protein n=1 Tax=Nocardia terpenica TaxID=455432 RepID=UPI001893F92F|nr:methionine ABC transporter substrate-binding protein [Nocardia terpenica]MBF6102872.1 methionine ABC transporter substrate-binding protein [Nocardia terpenica]MBF6110939.1 methionine ABC transporter substrate-binding protein [Nocardia terpenica]MBF6117070.1 methionine ABC transporter substrate-binding protein [Nocardia terpenica]MBF6151092.1 methionine ABC transporter substrate-binding protein [Nocardia terpenica]
MHDDHSGARVKFHRVLAIPVLVTTAALTLTACGGNDSSASGTVVRIGTTDRDSVWEVFEKKAKEQGITLRTTNFSDYKQPNLALSQKQIDVNLFQHLQFLGQYNVAGNDTLTPIGATYIVPLGLYSKKHKALADIPQGGEIAIPNDPTNQARALFVLRSAGLVTFTGTPRQPTPADIDKNASKVKVTPVDAAQTALSLASVDGSVINDTFLQRSGVDPHTALFKDDPKDPSAEPYINALVTRAADKNNPVYLRLVEVWHDPEVQRAEAAATKDTAVEVHRSGPELEQILQRVQQTIREQK